MGTWRGTTADIPAWLVAVVSSVIAHYFGSRNGSNGRPRDDRD